MTRCYVCINKESPTRDPTPLVLFIHGNGGAYNFANGSRSYELMISLVLLPPFIVIPRVFMYSRD